MEIKTEERSMGAGQGSIVIFYLEENEDSLYQLGESKMTPFDFSARWDEELKALPEFEGKKDMLKILLEEKTINLYHGKIKHLLSQSKL